ncbi:hypothetical protein KFU94_58935 [Chloroflexi bacterium TSY]|nr:hypothetical protein [Chloroflexi bacterium TSY]
MPENRHGWTETYPQTTPSCDELGHSREINLEFAKSISLEWLELFHIKLGILIVGKALLPARFNDTRQILSGVYSEI